MKPPIKTLRDKFRLMMKERRTVNRENATSSGIDEKLTDIDQLMDDLIHEKDTEDEERKEKKDEKTEKEAQLVRVGEELRNAAVSRSKKKRDDERIKRKE